MNSLEEMLGTKIGVPLLTTNLDRIFVMRWWILRNSNRWWRLGLILLIIKCHTRNIFAWALVLWRWVGSFQVSIDVLLEVGVSLEVWFSIRGGDDLPPYILPSEFLEDLVDDIEEEIRGAGIQVNEVVFILDKWFH